MPFEDSSTEKAYRHFRALSCRRWDRIGSTVTIMLWMIGLARHAIRLVGEKKYMVGLAVLNEAAPAILTLLPDPYFVPARPWVVGVVRLSPLWLLGLFAGGEDIGILPRLNSETGAAFFPLILLASKALPLAFPTLAHPLMVSHDWRIVAATLPVVAAANAATCASRAWDPAVEARVSALGRTLLRLSSLGLGPAVPRRLLGRDATGTLRCNFALDWLMVVLGIARPHLLLARMEALSRQAFAQGRGQAVGRAPAAPSCLSLALALGPILGLACLVALTLATVPALLGVQ
ncbi:hypothetical protein F751_4427 [Auxenochlorella protothecoides]|uniref:Uncharacterized protein n=1 Tax=Auxenochlorella protothecoides TaxID=3075 RepID=A0A087SN53_AUXPR|nr:hypothetical protein F751_4427 [Auxenochlorella protothecoides]KFM27157.1 hypothetical protein F751_4427 [Auxenochlorella protothecoides]RMZ57066.1 hypothetical protein APUTEX25_002298 [Auxenochlorella protothecoides]|eukprot:RMZ57066.1 hypothetical protein APUTEX25_002298 [Auxenochlorella protothecoides]